MTSDLTPQIDLLSIWYAVFQFEVQYVNLK